ncbi:hypothetical protein VP01_567g5 [Puccinia sorghi]|uniref:BZIP domain-containing protein n=1 Tax=Puccinia sorghi TaxID=27349 RepID=A0A0L6UIR8_9BASI|nr:hypothetical protein VP01_567g5 [Puccinia sorghi]
MKRGRKQDDTLPPSRSREIQRAFRLRRQEYIKGLFLAYLENRVSQLEAEVDEILARHNEPLRYITPDSQAAKRLRNKSKHCLTQFLNVNQPVQPPQPHSPSDPLCVWPEDSVGIPPSVDSDQSTGPDISNAASAQYIIRDVNGKPTRGSFTPFILGGQVEHQHECARRDDDSSTPSLARRNQRLLHLWNGASGSDNLSASSPESPGAPSSQFSRSISVNEYHNCNSQMDMLLGIDSVVQSPVASSQLMSSFDWRPEVRVTPSSCSLPSLVTASSPQPDQLTAIGFNSYQSSSEADLSPYTFRSPHSHLPDRMNPCYTFVDSSNDSSPNLPMYRQENPPELFQPRPSFPAEHTFANGLLSSLVSIAATRIDHFEPSILGSSHQNTALKPSPEP